MKTRNKPTRRCQRFECDVRFEIDLLQPGDELRRYCSAECAELDESPVRAARLRLPRLDASDQEFEERWQRLADPGYYRNLRVAWGSTLARVR
ncbi:MAG: hypothetical protein JO326_01290 [Acetobacteraceae bacterium]|nr:hypothetical protein [Acetobacteraceae bacterium]